ncbi:hypothetical protein Taro_041412, partial [Colocasia esculenta]|nr:hypothetical protein [Colocasia esculenta]
LAASFDSSRWCLIGCQPTPLALPVRRISASPRARPLLLSSALLLRLRSSLLPAPRVSGFGGVEVEVAKGVHWANLEGLEVHREPGGQRLPEAPLVPVGSMGTEAGASTSSSGGRGSHPHLPTFASRRRSRGFHRFTQQNLPACKSVLTPGWVIMVFLLTGTIFIPVGLVALRASQIIVEIEDRYDNDCVPMEFRSNKVAYIKDSSISKNCTRTLKVPKHMKAPINIYYQLDNFYQNHRRYVKSRNDRQLQYGLKYKDTSSCKPEEYSNGLPIVPCGLIAWSLFNDSFMFVREHGIVNFTRENIAWESDRKHKFGKDVYPFNFQNGTLIGGGKLNPNLPLSKQEDLIIWMRTAALPSFRKLYGRIEEDLNADELLTVRLVNNYNTYSFGGKKKLVLSTTNWFGGKNDFLGVAYISTGCCCILIAIAFALLHVRNPRPYGDPALLSWNWKSGSR